MAELVALMSGDTPRACGGNASTRIRPCFLCSDGLPRPPGRRIAPKRRGPAGLVSPVDDSAGTLSPLNCLYHKIQCLLKNVNGCIEFPNVVDEFVVEPSKVTNRMSLQACFELLQL